MTNHVSCGKLLKQINDELRKRLDNQMRSQDLTIAQLDVLLELYYSSEKQMSMKQLEKNLHVAQSTTAGIVSRLEQKKMVERFGDAADKRMKMVRITQGGTERILEMEQGKKQTEELLFSGLTETEQDILYSLLKKVRNTLE